MSSNRDEGPVYYREIQKNAYLKRIPADYSNNKLRPLGHKKPPLKPMWTLFCVHNGRTPYLEQYPEREHASTLTHTPVWRACLITARHVTASVTPRVGNEYDFLVDTEHGSVRMLAPDWESMQDWVQTLRTKLHELKIVSCGENVYSICRSAIVGPRAPARDPTSPLPPTPPTPPVRVPGIEPPVVRPSRPDPEPSETPPSEVVPSEVIPSEVVPSEVVPSEVIPSEVVPSEVESPEIDISNWEDSGPMSLPLPSTSHIQVKKNVKICGQNICLDDSVLKRTSATDSDDDFFAEMDRLSDSVVNLNFDSVNSDDYKQTVLVSEKSSEEHSSDNQGPNVTVIQVSNKEPPHTAIPVMGPETNVFEFEFKNHSNQHTPNQNNFINIVNTENNADTDYGTVFSKDDYGHVSLMSTVNVTDVNVTGVNVTDVNVTAVNGNGIYERLCMASTSNANKSPLPLKKVKNQDKYRKTSLPNLDAVPNESPYEYLFTGNTVNNSIGNTVNNGTSTGNTFNNSVAINNNSNNRRTNLNSNGSVPINLQVNRPIISHNVNAIRANIERSFSQNEYDTSPRIREHSRRRIQHNSPKRDVKIEKTESNPSKAIWKRGLTELTFLSRLRGAKQGKRQESPVRHDNQNERSMTSPVKVVHRSRPERRVDNARRRSSSLSNGVPPPPNQLQPLIVMAAASLRSEQLRGAAIPASFSVRDAPVVCEYNDALWVCKWSGIACSAGRAGDRLVAVGGRAVTALRAARGVATAPRVDVLYHRVPLAKIYVINKRDRETIGIKLDSECNITYIDPKCRVQLPPGRWALTQVNGRQLNLLKGTEEEMKRLSLHGTEVSILVQPSALVKKMRAALKANVLLVTMK